jgi:hypothetical protein
MPKNNLVHIDGCDGWECIHSSLCNEHDPESCPLYTDQFEMDPDEEVDRAMDHA